MRDEYRSPGHCAGAFSFIAPEHHTLNHRLTSLGVTWGDQLEKMDRKESLKLVLKAIRERQPDNKGNSYPDSNLPDLYSTERQTYQDQEQYPETVQQLQQQRENPFSRWSWDRGLLYDPGFAKFKLSKKGLRASGGIDSLGLAYDALLNQEDSRLNLSGMFEPLNMKYEANLRQNGDVGLRASLPLLKGLLNLEANRKNDQDRYQLQYQRNF